VNPQKPFVEEALIIPTRSSFSRLLTEDLVFVFAEGIPAFEEIHRYTLVNEDAVKPFVYLKSVDKPPLRFVCMDPFLVYSSYCVKLTGQDLVRLKLRGPGEALVLCLVTVNDNPKMTTANLMAPLVINIAKCLGRQVIQEDYPLRFKLWEANPRQERRVRRPKHAGSDTEVG